MGSWVQRNGVKALSEQIPSPALFLKMKIRKFRKSDSKKVTGVIRKSVNTLDRGVYSKKFISNILNLYTGKKLIELSKWNDTTVDIKSIQKASIIGGEELIEEMILVSQKEDEVQIMDQKNYEIKVVKKPKPASFNSKTVKIVKLGDRLFLIPAGKK